MQMEEGMQKASSARARKQWRKLLAGVNRTKIEVTTTATSGSCRFRRSASAANASFRSDEVAMVHVNQAPISTEEFVYQFHIEVTSTGTSTETEYYSCTDSEQDDDEGNRRVHYSSNSSNRSITMETNFNPTNVQQSNPGNENREQCCRTDGSRQKVLEWILAIANVIVELLSMVFDQLSSQHKHKHVFLLVCLGMSILAVLICLGELVRNIRKEKAIWKWKGFFPCFYYHFVSFADVIGLACACGQCILTTINYALFLEHGNTPIKVSIWPSIFACGQLCSKMWGESRQNVHRRESSPADHEPLVELVTRL